MNNTDEKTFFKPLRYENKKELTQSRLKIIRILFLIAGCLSLALGCVGIVLPVLPTVPFFLLTAFCFAKGSKRFHDWFIATKVYKKYMSGFAEHKSMSIGGELVLMISVTAMLIGACLMTQNVLAMAIVLPLLVACKYGFFIFKVNTVSKAELEELKRQKALQEDGGKNVR